MKCINPNRLGNNVNVDQGMQKLVQMCQINVALSTGAV
jgi:hypothetical protein